MNKFYFVLNSKSYVIVIAESGEVAREAFTAVHPGHWAGLSDTCPNVGVCIETIKQRVTN